MDKNKMLEEVRDRYLKLLNEDTPKRELAKREYNRRMQLLVLAAQCLIASGAKTELGWNFENNFDIKTYWPNFLYEMDKPNAF